MEERGGGRSWRRGRREPELRAEEDRGGEPRADGGGEPGADGGGEPPAEGDGRAGGGGAGPARRRVGGGTGPAAAADLAEAGSRERVKGEGQAVRVNKIMKRINIGGGMECVVGENFNLEGKIFLEWIEYFF